MKTFLSFSKTKLFFSILFFLIILIYSVRFDAKVICGNPPDERGAASLDGCGQNLNPILWLPVALFSPSHTFEFYGSGGMPYFLINPTILVSLMLLYWFMVSYFLSCFIVHLFTYIAKGSMK